MYLNDFKLIKKLFFIYFNYLCFVGVLFLRGYIIHKIIYSEKFAFPRHIDIQFKKNHRL